MTREDASLKRTHSSYLSNLHPVFIKGGFQSLLLCYQCVGKITLIIMVLVFCLPEVYYRQEKISEA